MSKYHLDSAADLPADITAEQREIWQAANDLLALLDRLVPQTTMHYAVEQARDAARVLRGKAPTVQTNDYVARREAVKA